MEQFPLRSSLIDRADFFVIAFGLSFLAFLSAVFFVGCVAAHNSDDMQPGAIPELFIHHDTPI